jgi:hypothetical protein
MAMAMTGGRDLRRMRFDLDIEDNWPPVAVETLWVEAVENARFRIDSIPFLVRGIAINDIVEGREDSADTPSAPLRFSRRIEPGGHSTIQVIVVADEVTSAVTHEVVKAGCRIEGSPWPSLFSIDIPDGKLIDAVHNLLRIRAALGQLEYEDACLASSGTDRKEQGDNPGSS